MPSNERRRQLQWALVSLGIGIKERDASVLFEAVGEHGAESLLYFMGKIGKSPLLQRSISKCITYGGVGVLIQLTKDIIEKKPVKEIICNIVSCSIASAGSATAGCYGGAVGFMIGGPIGAFIGSVSTGIASYIIIEATVNKICGELGFIE